MMEVCITKTEKAESEAQRVMMMEERKVGFKVRFLLLPLLPSFRGMFYRNGNSTRQK